MSNERMTVPNDTAIVVFIIGLKVRNWLRIDRWLPITLAMIRMQRQLAQDPELGLLSIRNFGTTSIQYWKSKDHLLEFANKETLEHRPAWLQFYRRTDSKAVGIWHETYLVQPRDYEALYVNTKTFGLGRALGRIPVSEETKRAAQRLTTTS